MSALISKIDYQKYPSYVNSGIEGIGLVPSTWNKLSNKYIFCLKKNQVGKKSDNYVLLSLTLNGIIKRDMENPQGKFPAEFNTYQEVKKGDFVFCLFDVEETPCAVGLSDYDGMITGAYTVFQANKNFDKKFLYYYYLNLDNDKRLKPLYTGLRNIVSKENFFSFKTFFPPKEEQTAIAKFLDKKIELIDQAIKIKEKQIELLKERKQIIIQNAVTRGLNPNVKLKDSGVEWIGNIPEHWEVKRIRNLSQMIVSNVDKLTKSYEELVKLCNYVDVYKNEYITNSLDFMEATAKPDEISRFKIKINDVLITKDSEDWLDIGVPALVQYEADNLICGYHLAILRPNKFITGLYLYFSLLSTAAKTQFSIKANGVTRYGISHGAILGSFMAVPPVDEQEVISDHLTKSVSKIVITIDLKINEIQKLKEYRSTLIDKAVTGKIKVS